MSDKTGIGWTDATWNPVTGCSHVSEGCRNCYAETLSFRWGRTTLPWTARNAKANVVIHPSRLKVPLSWRQPRRVFVNSMSDLFHEEVPDHFIVEVFEVMAEAERHSFQVLTKRPERMREFMADAFAPGYTLLNVWLGTSVEDQRAADERIPHLLATPAAVRFLSCEPLLGPINLEPGHTGTVLHNTENHEGDGMIPAIDWVIVGGESGPNYRPMQLEWLERIVSDCRAAGIPVFVKQDSGRFPGKQGRIPDALWIHEFPASPSGVGEAG